MPRDVANPGLPAVSRPQSPATGPGSRFEASGLTVRDQCRPGQKLHSRCLQLCRNSHQGVAIPACREPRPQTGLGESPPRRLYSHVPVSTGALVNELRVPVVQGPRTPAFHAGNAGSNPAGDAKFCGVESRPKFASPAKQGASVPLPEKRYRTSPGSGCIVSRPTIRADRRRCASDACCARHGAMPVVIPQVS